MRLLQPLRAEAGDLGRYCGYYFEYANCMSVPGSILLSLVHLYEEDGVFLFERQERQERTSSTDVQAEDGRVAAISARPSSCRTGCS